MSYQVRVTHRRIRNFVESGIEVCIEFEDEPVGDSELLCCRNDITACRTSSLLSIGT